MPTVDDRDSSIEYFGKWISGGTGDTSNEFRATAHVLQTITSGAGVRFSFTGASASHIIILTLTLP